MSIENKGNFSKDTKKAKNVKYLPRLERWEIYFYEKDGFDNRDVVARAFTDFLGNNKSDRLDIPGNCVMGGRVFGHEKIEDGDDLFTQYIQSVERIKRNSHSGVTRDLICATTVLGEKYYFYSDDYNIYMFLMMTDLINKDKLDLRPNYYLEHGLWKTKFI